MNYPPVGIPQAAPVGYPQAQAPGGYPAPLAQPVPQPLAQSAFAQQLANSAMGAAYVQVLPPGHYTAVLDKLDWANTDTPNPMLFVEVIVETSDNGTPHGFKGKLSPIFFGASKWTTQAEAYAKGLAKIGQLVGCNSIEELDARIPNWRQAMFSDPNFGRGCKLAIVSAHAKNDAKGKPVYNTTAQRVA